MGGVVEGGVIQSQMDGEREGKGGVIQSQMEGGRGTEVSYKAKWMHLAGVGSYG